jgi:hypothetical protein
VQFGRPVCGFALLGLILASPVAAQEPGVHVDPNSPAGKEYAIPIDQARRQAEGASAGNGSHGSSGSAPLFGAGISSRAGGSSSSSGSGKSGAGAAGSTKTRTEGSRKSDGARSAGANARLAGAAAADTGSSATFLTAAVVAAVLLAGGLIGLVLHRLNRGRPD